jgi:hypothetical protein
MAQRNIPRYPSKQYNSPLQPIGGKKTNCCNCCVDMAEALKNINTSASKIIAALKAEHLLDKKTAEKLKKEKEENERREKESLLERTSGRVSSTLKAAIAPLKNVMDSIFKFILFTLAGRAIGKILKWFADPANEKKVKSLTRFLRDWWPAILGAFVLFGTRFGAAIRATVRMAVSTILYLKRIGIPGIIAGLKKLGKFGLIVGGGAGAIALAYKLLNPEEKKDERTQSPKTNSESSKGYQTPLKMASGGMVPRLNLVFPEEKHVNEISYVEGGAIDTTSGISITGAGPDTQLIAAQPGEIVISKAAVDKFGADTFLRMNLMAGATNRPKFANNIQFAKEGGMIGKAMQTPNPSINVSSPKVILPPSSFSYQNTPGKTIFSNRPGGMRSSSENVNKQNITLQNYNTSLSNFDYKQYSNGLRGREAESPKVISETTNISQTNKQPSISADSIFKQTSITYPSRSSESFFNQTNPVYSRPSYSNNQIPMPRASLQNWRTNFIKPNINQRDYSKFSPESYTRENNQLQVSRNYDQQLEDRLSFKVFISPNQTTLKAPRPKKSSSPSIVELPAIDLRATKSFTDAPAHSDVPDFSAIPRISDRYGETGTLAIYGIEL